MPRLFAAGRIPARTSLTIPSETHAMPKITDADIGTEFTIAGIDSYTYRLVWFSDVNDWCGVIPSWATTPTQFMVRTSTLRRIIPA